MQLFKHQEEGIAFLIEKKRAILADEMGLGKTRQAIIAAGQDDAKGVIIVCPASLKINWEREVRMVYPEDKIYTVQSGKIVTLPTVPWIVINYDMLPKYQEQILRLVADGKLDTGIIDEAHYIKGKKTVRATVTLEVMAGLEKVYALTGTPIMNRPIEMFNLLRAIRHPLGEKRTFFSKRYCGGQLKTLVLRGGRILRFYDEKGATHLEELREFIKGSFLRRLKKDVLDLPEKIISVQVADLSKEWKKEYDTAFENYISFVKENPDDYLDEKDPKKKIEDVLAGVMSAKHLVELTKLKQVCSKAKIERMVADIRSAVDQGQKVIVFSQFTGTIQALKEELAQSKRGSKFDDAKDPILAVTLTGQDDMHVRQKAVDAFQSDDDTKVFIANIKAGGVGITLTAASIVMFADMEWSPELHSQAEDRAHRIGQTGTVNVYYYVAADTIEEDIIDILEAKRAIIKELMNGKDSARWAQEAERISLLTNEEERIQALQELTAELEKSTETDNLSMAAEFLNRLKTKLHIHN